MPGERRDVLTAVADRQQYLSVAGGLLLLVGLVLAAWVGYEWFGTHTSHLVIAIAAGIVTVIGVQLLVFAAMVSMLVALYREQEWHLAAEGRAR